MEQNKDYEKRLTTNGGVVQCCRKKNAGKPYSRMKEKLTCSLMRGNDLLYILFCLLLWKLCKDDSGKHDDTSKDFFST